MHAKLNKSEKSRAKNFILSLELAQVGYKKLEFSALEENESKFIFPKKYYKFFILKPF